MRKRVILKASGDDPILKLWAAAPGARWTGDEFDRLTLGARLLLRWGDPAGLEAQWKTIRAAVKTLERANWLPGDQRAKTLEAVNRAGDHLKAAWDAARRAEAELAAKGWKLDPKNGKLRAIIDAKAPNRPRELLNEVIARAYDRLTRKDPLVVGRNTRAIRENIHRIVRPIFPPEFLGTPSVHDPIWRAVENARKRV